MPGRVTRTTEAAALHVIRRASYGPTPALVERVLRIGPDAWIAEQLDAGRVPDTRMTTLLRRWPELSWTPAMVHARTHFGWNVMYAVRAAHTARAAWSQRQLFEVLVDVWSNALNVPCPSGDVWDNRHLYDRDVIRRHALGRFEDMLVAAVTHPSMLRYLSNASSTKKHPNENLGRELLELHTVGRASGYTEADVRQSARILTGLSVSERTGLLEFRAKDHAVGPVRVLGFTHPNAAAQGGLAVAVAYLRFLARHPLTAHNVAHRLAVRFVSDTPPRALVNALAATYLTTGPAIRPMLQQLFASPEFRASAGEKTRTPFEDLIAGVRVLGIAPPRAGADLGALGWLPSQLGQPPLAHPQPDGYPDVAAAWSGPGTTLARWNSHVALAARWDSKLNHPDPARWLPQPLPPTYGGVVNGLAARLFVDLTPHQVRAVCAFANGAPTTPVDTHSELTTWRLPGVVALILDAPQALLR